MNRLLLSITADVDGRIEKKYLVMKVVALELIQKSVSCNLVKDIFVQETLRSDGTEVTNVINQRLEIKVSMP